MTIEFAFPWAFLLLPLPLVALKFAYKAHHGEAALVLPLYFTERLLARSAENSGSLRTLKWRFWTLCAVWLLMILALAGPRTALPVKGLHFSGRDVALVLDLSGSMVREDFYLDGAAISRLNAVKTVASAFARRRVGDRLGLVIFGSEAYVASSLTFDTEAVAQRIETAQIGISGRATNMADGLGLALKRLKQSDAPSRVAILLSDGVHNAGTTTPVGVAQLALSMGVRVHTIALGPKDVQSAAPGERGVVDHKTLQTLAKITGGESFRVRSLEDLRSVSDALDQLEPIKRSGLVSEIYQNYWPWFAAIGLFLAIPVIWGLKS